VDTTSSISNPPVEESLYTTPNPGSKVSIMGGIYQLIMDDCQDLYVIVG
jgi:hypothetical protein